MKEYITYYCSFFHQTYLSNHYHRRRSNVLGYSDRCWHTWTSRHGTLRRHVWNVRISYVSYVRPRI